MSFFGPENGHHGNQRCNRNDVLGHTATHTSKTRSFLLYDWK